MKSTSTSPSPSPSSSTSNTSSRTARGGREHADASPTPGLHRDGFTALDYKPLADSEEFFRTMSQIDGKKGRYSLFYSTRVPLLRVHGQLWLWVVLFTVLLSASSAYSAKTLPKPREGQCRYDLTSIAALSCMQKDGVRKPPSHACCKALLYAIDQVPVEEESGACCLCRYMIKKMRTVGLATAYILCNGKDRRIVAKWSSVPSRCSDECGQGNSTSLGTETEHDDTPVVQTKGTGKGQAYVSTKGTGKVIWVVVVVPIVIGVVFFWYFRRFKVVENAIEPRARRRRSDAPSSTKRKGRRH